MLVDHVTYQIPHGEMPDTRDSVDNLGSFFSLLEMTEVQPEQKVEEGWTVRWFEDMWGFQIHIVEAENNMYDPQLPSIGLGHFCAHVTQASFDEIKANHADHDSGSGRVWIEGPFGLRVEVWSRESRKSARESSYVMRHDSPTLDSMMQRKDIPGELWAHHAVLERALDVYAERNETYKDNWKKQGWRGALFKLKLKVERAWEVLWDEDPNNLDPKYMDLVTDDLIDAINNAAFAVRAVESGNRDGVGGWF